MIALTTIMTVGEVGAGIVHGSMALEADGRRMSTHAVAALIAAFA